MIWRQTLLPHETSVSKSGDNILSMPWSNISYITQQRGSGIKLYTKDDTADILKDFKLKEVCFVLWPATKIAHNSYLRKTQSNLHFPSCNPSKKNGRLFLAGKREAVTKYRCPRDFKEIFIYFKNVNYLIFPPDKDDSTIINISLAWETCDSKNKNTCSRNPSVAIAPIRWTGTTECMQLKYINILNKILRGHL